MLWSQAPVRKLTRCEGVKKESGLWEAGAARVPRQPPLPSHYRVPRSLQSGRLLDLWDLG